MSGKRFQEVFGLDAQDDGSYHAWRTCQHAWHSNAHAGPDVVAQRGAVSAELWQSGFGKAFNGQHTAMGAKSGKAKQTPKDY